MGETKMWLIVDIIVKASLLTEDTTKGPQLFQSLGMPICAALTQIEQQHIIYYVVLLKYYAELVNCQDPLKLDMDISFLDHSTALIFVLTWYQGHQRDNLLVVL